MFFDIGFPELMVIAVVTLVVIGPERLPQTLRTLGLWLGRARRAFTSVKTEIEREIGMDEVRRELHNESIMDEMRKIESEVQNTIAEGSIDPSLNFPEPPAPTQSSGSPEQVEATETANPTSADEDQEPATDLGQNKAQEPSPEAQRPVSEAELEQQHRARAMKTERET